MAVGLGWSRADVRRGLLASALAFGALGCSGGPDTPAPAPVPAPPEPTTGPYEVHEWGLIAASSGADVTGEAGLKEAVREATARVERELIVRALEKTQGNVTHTARLLKISRKSLQTKMKELGLREDG